MRRSVYLRCTANWYLIGSTAITLMVVVLSLSLLIVPWWLYLLGLTAASYSFGSTLLRQFLGSGVTQIHIYMNSDGKLCMTLPKSEVQAKSWKVTWRSRRLVVIVFGFGWSRLPVSVWLSPHSLTWAPDHRQVRMLCRFNQSS